MKAFSYVPGAYIGNKSTLKGSQVKALLHEAIFCATGNATNVALQVAKKIARLSRLTPHFRNLQCNKMLQEK